MRSLAVVALAMVFALISVNAFDIVIVSPPAASGSAVRAAYSMLDIP